MPLLLGPYSPRARRLALRRWILVGSRMVRYAPSLAVRFGEEPIGPSVLLLGSYSLAKLVEAAIALSVLKQEPRSSGGTGAVVLAQICSEDFKPLREVHVIAPIMEARPVTARILPGLEDLSLSAQHTVQDVIFRFFTRRVGRPDRRKHLVETLIERMIVNSCLSKRGNGPRADPSGLIGK